MNIKTIAKSIVKNTIDFLRIFTYNICDNTGKDVESMRETKTVEFKEMITNSFLKQ